MLLLHVFVLTDISTHFPKVNCRLMKNIFKTQFTKRKKNRYVYLNIPFKTEKCFSNNNINGIMQIMSPEF